jgi:hypothetical protein
MVEQWTFNPLVLGSNPRRPIKEKPYGKLAFLEPRSVYDQMIVGLSDSPHSIVYDKDQIIAYLVSDMAGERSDLEEVYEEALEFFYYNIERGALYVGGVSFVSRQDFDLVMEE